MSSFTQSEDLNPFVTSGHLYDIDFLCSLCPILQTNCSHKVLVSYTCVLASCSALICGMIFVVEKECQYAICKVTVKRACSRCHVHLHDKCFYAYHTA